MPSGLAELRQVGSGKRAKSSRAAFYVWTAILLAIAVVVVVISWHARGGTTDPTDLPPGHSLSHTTVVIDSAILVFREGLETILVLAAVMASFLGGNRIYRRPVAAGSGAAIGAGVATWLFVVWLIGRFHGGEFDVQAATGLPSLLVLLLVMNWFFHKVYWTGWISSHHKRRRGLLSADPETNRRRVLAGLVLLGFTSVYRECFEIVIFLQNLRELYGASVVLEGVVIGLLFTAAAGVLTFALHQRLPYRRLLIITGVMLLFVLLVSVGEEVNEMQLAGWIGTTQVPGLSVPGWMGTWFSIFPNWETFAGQLIALAIVIGSYVGAQYMRVWRPRRRGRHAAHIAVAPPEERPGDRAARGTPANALA
ncbi:MAG TPA: FTR1 family protein [Solirubrobacteraceae bacterium]|nr:FTR1 family protein [Solirubrobacteraceae bacterium]